jgi:hypothetical protein
MRLLIGTSRGSGWVVPRSWIASFLIYDRQSLPVVFGVEYGVPEGIMRTFSESSSPEFRATLQRSGISYADRSGIVPGVHCLFCAPFLGKGVPDWTPEVARLLVISDSGKELFAARTAETGGGWETAAYGDAHFSGFVRSVFP